MADQHLPKFTAQDVVYFEYKKPDVASQRVFLWDIDKTYLDTKFETFKGLIQTAFEKAFQKRNVPGTATLIQALESSKLGTIPLYFITASPPQMERKIYQKMRLDHIEPMGIFFKDNLKNIRPSKFKRLKQHVGFKVQSLLELRLLLPENIKFTMFGDDSESDAVIYSLFSDICSRRIQAAEFLSVLEALHTTKEQRLRIQNLQKKIPVDDPVDRIYINLVNDTDPDYYSKFGRRVLGTFTTFQAALDLFQMGLIDIPSLVKVGQDMVSNYGFTPEELGKSLEDLFHRGFINSENVRDVLEALKSESLLPNYFSLIFKPVVALQALMKTGEKILGLEREEPWVPERIDYLNDFR